MAIKEKAKSFTTPVFRISFPNLFVAKAGEDGGKLKFGCQAIWTPANFTATDKKLWNEMVGALNDECIKRFKKPLKEMPANFKKGIREGAEKELEGYGAGTRFASLTSTLGPGVVDRDKQVISPEEGNADDIYPGCYCRAKVTVYSYDNKGRGVALGLRNVQKVKDGDRLDSRVSAQDDFDDDIDPDWLDQDEPAVDADDNDI